MSKELSKGTKKEEIRGLFVLGLLAVLASVRVQYSTMMVNIGQSSFDIIVFFDLTIVLWSFYAFFMIFGLSEDMIGKTMASVCIDTAKAFLTVNFLALFTLGFLFTYSAYQTRFLWALGLVGFFGLLFFIVKFKKRKKRPFNVNLKETFASSIHPFLILVLFIAFILIMLGDKDFILPSFVVGCIAIAILVYLKLKKLTQTEPQKRQ